MLPRLNVYPRLQLHISFSDLAASLLSFLSVSNREQNIREIQSFGKSDKEVLVTLSVRTSLALMLQSLNLPPGSEVLMSAVNIRDMVEVVKRHGLVPVPVDISLDKLTPSLPLLESLISQKSRVFLVAHLFGSIINLEPYAQLCKKHNLLLVEDCAQAFTGSKYYGYEEADVSFFSFGPIKSCTALGGAVTLIRDKTLAEKMQSLEEKYPCKSEFWFFKRVLKYLGLKLFSIPGIYAQLLAFLRLLDCDLDGVINSLTRGFTQGDILAKIRYRPPNQMLSLLNRRLKNCNTQWFERRELKARNFLSQLAPEILCPGHKAEYHSFWVVPILVSNPELLMANLRKQGFDATRGNTSLACIKDLRSHDTLSAFSPLNGECLIEQVLYLPVSESLPEQELESLAKQVNDFYLASRLSQAQPRATDLIIKTPIQ
ncbi:aminotransferase class V-fold PLP-dependent enzyme [Allocoleopsis franciscana]|uniref:Putative PLP-dependent enzyme possibly involved in cell wall biogenesis n=1 Tax=Allocoleopsis franciscana PCC 7113 TaxID=1173027 RepID=K9WCV1_9CYAN|nr:aminotransferase class V-fold PLP-dependent enzyme [Allocoleopsis franciscana]AFZ17372.1 putative PLP-dependent enzyme possibly involved in cell wall biogenesis [Allocoleopsis franciscana PCC 7113]